jgi:hypothetical protein
LPEPPKISRVRGAPDHLQIGHASIAACLVAVLGAASGMVPTPASPGTCAFMPRHIPHAWKNIDSETGRVLFLYTPAEAGGLIEALSEGRPIDKEEWPKLYERHRWEVVGPNPL